MALLTNKKTTNNQCLVLVSIYQTLFKAKSIPF